MIADFLRATCLFNPATGEIAIIALSNRFNRLYLLSAHILCVANFRLHEKSTLGTLYIFLWCFAIIHNIIKNRAMAGNLL
jgi:hypothetical protein